MIPHRTKGVAANRSNTKKAAVHYKNTMDEESSLCPLPKVVVENNYAILPQTFSSLTAYKAIAKAHQNTSGCDLFKERTVIYPMLHDPNTYCMVEDNRVNFINLIQPSDEDNFYDRKIYTEFFGIKIMDYVQRVEYQGTTYYVVLPDDKAPNAYIFAFVDSCCTFSLISSPFNYEMSIMDFVELSIFKSESF